MSRSFKFRIISNLSLIIGAIAVIVAIIVYLGVDISHNSKFIAETQQELLSRVAAINTLSKLKEQEKAADAALFKLNSALPKRAVLFSVNRDLEEMARRRGLSFSSKFGQEIVGAEGRPSVIRLDMNVRGSYNNIIGFMSDMEKSNYFINILSFDIIQQGSEFASVLSSEVFFNE